MPKISAVIITYNEEKFIGKCLDSIINQTYPKDQLELLVVDGMSTDKTREMVKELTGLIRGNGFEPKIKPESFVASTVADRYS